MATSIAVDAGVSPAPRFGHVGIWTGADLLIFANQRAGDDDLVDRVISTLGGAVAAGRLPEASIDESYTRILAAKARLAKPIGESDEVPAAAPADDELLPAEKIIAQAPAEVCPVETAEDAPG